MATLAERLKKTDRLRNRAIFNALRTEVDAALRAGWTIKQIWRRLQKDGAIKCSYKTFCYYVRTANKVKVRFTPEVGGVLAAPQVDRPDRARAPKEQPAPAAPQGGAVITSFTMEHLDKEDLI